MILLDLPDAAYRAFDALSHSELKLFRQRTAFHLAAKRKAGVSLVAPSPQMAAGSLLHTLALEPAAFWSRYVVMPDDIAGVTKATKVYKDWAAQQPPDRLIISPDDHLRALDQCASLRRIDDIAKLMDRGAAEVSIAWTDPVTSVRCKGRLDRVVPFPELGGVVILDLKTTQDASKPSFRRSIGKYGYHTQAAWYSRGYELASAEAGEPLQVLGFVFGVVESDYPYAAAPYMLSDRALARGMQLNADALARYAECRQLDEWPGYPRFIEVLDLMPWDEKETEE